MKNRFTKGIAKILLVVLSAAILSGVLSGCGSQENSRYLRVHIRANSNLAADQDIKQEIRQAVTEFLTPELAKHATDKDSALSVVRKNMGLLEARCNNLLTSSGFDYGAKLSLSREMFPLRSYGEFTFDEGIYDALIVNLGDGAGDNWWCMVYPPLCFVGGEDDGSGEIKYKSVIAELIEKFKRQYYGAGN